jgi:hypothetical protein
MDHLLVKEDGKSCDNHMNSVGVALGWAMESRQIVTDL